MDSYFRLRASRYELVRGIYNWVNTRMKENRVVDSMEPYEKWDLVAWPGIKTYKDEFEEAFDRLSTPHLDGKPTRIGYVQSTDEDYVYVKEAEHRMYGEPPIKNPCLEVPIHVRKDEILAKKQREHNQRYQREKRREAKRKAKVEWRGLSFLERMKIWLSGGKLMWIAEKKEEILDNQ